MSLISILVKGFSGLGVASTVPLSFAFHNESFTLKPRTRVVPPPATFNQNPQPSQPMDQMVKILEEELGSAGKQIDIGCFAVSGDRMTLKRPSLFVCTNLASTDLVTFWFHYNWNNRTKTAQRVNQVTSMSYQSSRRVSLHFKSGGSGNLTTFDEIPDWLNKWKGKPFDTKTTCSIKKEGSNDSYTLTCPSSDQKPFTQTIKSSDFHRPKTLSLG